MRINNQTSEDFRKNIGSYNSSTPFFKAIFDACKFGKFLDKKEITLLDGMSGPGKLGKDLLKIYKEQPDSKPNLRVFFNDIRAEPLAILKNEGFDVIQSDIRELDKNGIKFNIIAVRYGIKDFPMDQIPVALKAIYNSLESGGRLVIADMTAYSNDGQIGVIKFHSAKHEFAGRNLEKEGSLYIPQLGEWETFLCDAGFTSNGAYIGFTSDVETSQWKGQFGKNANDAEIIGKLNEFVCEIISTNPVFADEFQVKLDGEKVFVKFPIMVAYGEKP
ncbi:MAG: class I SAM-dependent methyltransferase [Candidatus Micrarchaeota archaeon]